MLYVEDLNFLKKTIGKMGYDSGKPFYLVGAPAENVINLHITCSPTKNEILFEDYVNNQENEEISFVDKFLCLLVEDKAGEVYLSFFSDMDDAIYPMIKAYTSETFGAFDPFVPTYKTVRFYYVPGNIDCPLHLLSVGAIVEGVSIENFGEVENGKIVNRAALGRKSNCTMHEYFDTLGTIDTVDVEEYWVNNLMEVSFYNKETDETRYTTLLKYATSFEELAVKVPVFMMQGEEPRISFGGGIYYSIADKATRVVEWLPHLKATIEEEWEHSLSYWKAVYEEGLAK